MQNKNSPQETNHQGFFCLSFLLLVVGIFLIDSMNKKSVFIQKISNLSKKRKNCIF